jgi:putative endonuclease
MAKHYDLGKKGEELAIELLVKKGYTILEKNFHYKKAEVDIIAQKENVLVCVEVKTRSSAFFGDPQDAVTKKKIKLLVKAMDYYIIEKDLDVEVRFDIIAIINNDKKTTIEHLKDAFYYFD